MAMSRVADWGHHMRGTQQASPDAPKYDPRGRQTAIDAEFVEVTTPPLLGPPPDEDETVAEK